MIMIIELPKYISLYLPTYVPINLPIFQLPASQSEKEFMDCNKENHYQFKR